MVRGEVIFITNWDDPNTLVKEIKDMTMAIICPGVYLHKEKDLVIIVEDELPETILYN